MPEHFMSIETVLRNNWDIRISLYEISESFAVRTYLSETARNNMYIEEELVNALTHNG